MTYKLIDILNEIILTEALPLSKAKEYASIKRNKAIQSRLDNIFNKLSQLPNSKQSKRRDRVYIPLHDKTQQSSIEGEVNQVLTNYGFALKDYQKGVATDKYGRDIKLGKVLNKLKQTDLLNKINTDKAREGSTKSSTYIVFSKHPYDVAGSSTDRGWTSCMNIYIGSNKQYVQRDVMQGTIVCYLVSSNDLNITKPIARILIKPYVNVKDKQDVLYVPERVYGTAPSQFKSQVSDIMDTVQGIKLGTFKLQASLYCDYKQQVTVHSKEIQDILDGKTRPQNKQQVQQILDALIIDNYTISDDLVVDVQGSVNLNLTNSQLKVIGIPVQFGVVDGDFNCRDNKLTSLQGAPKQVGGYFNCSFNNLTSLQGAPKQVGGNFICTYNKLTSLQGAPQKVGGYFDCSNNNNLTSLQGAPQKVDGDFICTYNKLTSLQGAPKQVGGNFICRSSKLTSLQGAPKQVGGNFNCTYNDLTSLQGAPQKVGGDFNCNDNEELASLQGAPKQVGGNFLCYGNATKFSEADVLAVSNVDGEIRT